jgi:hypothetical protein
LTLSLSFLIMIIFTFISILLGKTAFIIFIITKLSGSGSKK